LIDKIKSYNDVKTSVTNCRLCKLCNSRNNAVPGHGSLDAKILFVGEAPGKNEDKWGLPFIGFAGKLLGEALKKSGMDRDNVYITNVVKCRPPNNRVPDKNEIDTCLHYLENEIQIISPTIVCILGTTALQSVLNLKNMRLYHGKTITHNNIKYFVTYHPAATIYNNDLKELFFKEIGLVVDMAKEKS
jgi:uracil-DNA glycosylase family 4